MQFMHIRPERCILRWMISALIGICSLLWSAPAFAIEDIPLSLPAGRIVTHEFGVQVAALGVTLPTTESVDVQIKEEGKWTEWNTLVIDRDASPSSRSSNLLFVSDTSSIRLRSSEATQIVLHGIDVDTDPITVSEASSRQLAAPVIIPRWQWGADESLRIARRSPKIIDRQETFEDVHVDRVQNCSVRSRLYPEEFRETNLQFYDDEGNPLLWPVGYSSNINLFVIHHTADANTKAGLRTGVERMRAIYKYHTVSRGWGDIGYNYVVDTEGNIYEGRAGGPGAVGAHAYCNNVGTIGISLMGNFQLERPSDAQLQGLEILLSTLAKEYDVDPVGRATEHGKLLPTIIGHRDIGQTACAGQYFMELLPQIRNAVKSGDFARPLFSTRAVESQNHEAALVDYPDDLRLSAGQRSTFTLKLMNVGMETWGKDTWLYGSSQNVFFTKIFPFSYVAGFLKEDQVKPGETGTFEVVVQAGSAAPTALDTIELTPIIDNERKLSKDIVHLPVQLISGAAKYTYVTSYYPSLHVNGEDITVTLKLLNSGSVPWTKDTITGLDFALEGGKGELSVIYQPDIVEEGKQATYQIRLLNLNEEGSYEREIIPQFLGGGELFGQTVRIASRAEPLPPLTETPAVRQILAQSQEAFRQGKATTEGDHTIEAIAGTVLTLSPGEQVSLPLRIRAGKAGLSKGQDLAQYKASTPTLILRDGNKNRVQKTLKATESVRKFETYDTDLLLVTPRHEGKYTFSIGSIQFEVSVVPSARYKIRKKASSQILRTTTSTAEKTLARQALRKKQPSAESAEQTQSTTAELPLRIRLSYDRPDDATILADSPIYIQGQGGVSTARGTVHITRDHDRCTVISGDGQISDAVVTMQTQDPNGTISIASWSRPGNLFRGIVECRVIDEKIVFINELPIETYLRGLIEEPDTEPWQKQRAFAIAARSYAAFYVKSGKRKFPGLPYDGSDSPKEFQAYGGAYYEAKYPEWVKAVEDTRDKVLTWQRKIVKPPYHSSNAGMTRSALEVWGWADTPYLDAKPDPWCQGMMPAGHGVGMSGCGAEAQAHEGKTGEEILDYYYPGTRILPYNHEGLMENGGT